ncbi:MAG: lysophospholipid acyltransferase family protein [Rikenellaceae bacterium]
MFTTLYYLVMVLWSALIFVLSAFALVICAPFDRRRRVVHELTRMMARLFFAIPFGWRHRVEGMENLDRDKSYVVVMNHSHMLDIAALYFIPLNFRWVSKREVFNIPIFGQFLLLHGDIAIERGRGAEAMEMVIRDGKRWIGRGVSVAIFPEGTRSKTGQIGRFKAGAFNLAREAGVEVLPIVMEGTDRIIGKGGRFNWRNSVTLRILPAVRCESSDHVECRKLMDQVREDMVEALAEIRGDESKGERGKGVKLNETAK